MPYSVGEPVGFWDLDGDNVGGSVGKGVGADDVGKGVGASVGKGVGADDVGKGGWSLRWVEGNEKKGHQHRGSCDGERSSIGQELCSS